MLPDSHHPGDPAEWLRYAKADMAMAQVKQTPDMLLEGLCFHAQQASEKAIKAVLIACATPFPRTHNIGALLDLLPEDMMPPPEVETATGLTDYAVATRYPGEHEPVTDEEYQEAVTLAAAVILWAESILNPPNTNTKKLETPPSNPPSMPSDMPDADTPPESAP